MKLLIEIDTENVETLNAAKKYIDQLLIEKNVDLLKQSMQLQEKNFNLDDIKSLLLSKKYTKNSENKEKVIQAIAKYGVEKLNDVPIIYHNQLYHDLTLI